jgi:hypothetical protein
MRRYPRLGLIVTLTLLGSRAALGVDYSLLPVAKFGDTSGTVRISVDPDAAFEVGSLNDNGQLAFVTKNSAGGEILGLYSGGAWTPLVMAGGNAPMGKWPADVAILSPVSMNQLGNIAFTIDSEAMDSPSAETFLWDASATQFSLVAKNGRVVTFSETWDRGGDWVTAINNSGEMAYVAGTQDPQSLGRGGIFYQHTDGQVTAIALPDGQIEDGSTLIDTSDPFLNDLGAIVFTARRKGDPQDAGSAFRWLLGTRTRIAVPGTSLPQGHTVTNVLRAWVNNKNGKILLAVNTDATGASDYVETPISLFLWDFGLFTPVAVPGQTMPDGSKLLSVQDFGVSPPNELGQHAFLAILEGGATAAYLMDADGKLSLILKSGTVSSLGTITNVGEGAGTSSGIALNSSGQVALTAQIEVKPDTLFLLTPPAP